jgi:lysozyme
MVNGLDVSDYQAGINLAQVHAAGYSWAYIKATQGIDYVSPSFAPNCASAAAAGMLRGGYHYFIFNEDPKQQAQFFLNACPPAKGALPPAVDVEMGSQGMLPPPDQCVQNLSTFLQAVEAQTGVRCVLYMGYNGWSAVGSTTGFSGHPLWVPSYLAGVTGPPPQGQPPILQPPPPQITAWASWTMWQYTSSGNVSGFSGALDLDVFQGTLPQLEAMCQK